MSAELKVLGPGDQLGDAGFDVVQGVGQRCELLYGVLLPLIRGGRAHRWRFLEIHA